MELLADAGCDQPVVTDMPSSAVTMKSRALWLIATGTLLGVLLYAAYGHYPRGRTVQEAFAVDDVEQLQELLMPARVCSGTMHFAGLGQTAVINTKANITGIAQQIEVMDDMLVAHMGGRCYLGDKCFENTYDHTNYKAIPLLGNTLKYTVDLSGAGCGCNAAVYLVSMNQNDQISSCGDYYCDANSVCGVSCAEVDIQEANMFAWRSTLHTADDRAGEGFGYGGTGGLQSSWKGGTYGPGSHCIDTMRPFHVAVSFPVDSNDTLQGMQVTLTQDGSSCPLTGQISNYQANGVRDGMPEISKALADGMTPTVSFWSADTMGWLDGNGTKGGACSEDVASKCPDSVRIYGFSFELGTDSASAAAVPRRPTPVAPAGQAAAAPALASDLTMAPVAPTTMPGGASKTHGYVFRALGDGTDGNY